VIIYVDVDDTLVRSFGTKQFANTRLVDRLRLLCADPSVTAWCWSSGGAEYAEKVATELGIRELFAGFLPKPNLMIDDQAPTAWRDLMVLHPNEAMYVDAPTVRAQLKWLS
jgi:hypothetical protein